MKYEILEVSESEYEKFNQNISTYSLFQKFDFSQSRKYNYQDVKMLGFYADNVLSATTQLLIEEIPYIKKKMGTSIKGINIDFNNVKLLEQFQIALKAYLRANKFLLFRFDLPVAYKIMNRDFEESALNEMEIFSFPTDHQIKDKLRKSGFEEFFIDKNYMGRSPQYSMLVDTKSPENINAQLNRSVKRAIKMAQKYELEVNKINDPLAKSEIGLTYLEIFYELHQKNAAQNNINILPYEYYENIFAQTTDLSLFLVKINCEKFLKISKEELSKKSNKKIETLSQRVQNAVQDGQKEIYIVGHISGFFNKIGYDLFTGLNYDFKDLGSKELLMKYIFETAYENNVEYYDFWGILGQLDDKSPMLPIYNFKKKFSNIIVEYPGFWDIYTNKFLYKIFVKYSKIRYFRKNK